MGKQEPGEGEVSDVVSLDPSEAETMQAGVDVPAVSGVAAASVTEAFDEPLPMETVLNIASLFIA